MKKKILLFILLMSTFISSGFAYSKDLFRIDDKISLKDEIIEGTSFIIGNNVNIENEIKGILFQAGNNCLNEAKQDYLFLFGNTINVKNSNFKDGFVFGNTVDLSDSIIERDLYIFGNNININTNIGRDVKAFGNIVSIDSTIAGDVYIDAEDITIGDKAIINGTLTYPESAKIFISKDAVIKESKTHAITTKETEKTFFNKVTSNIISCLNMIVIGTILILIFKKLFENAVAKKENFFFNLGIGFVALLFVPIVSLILMTTVVGLSLGIILFVVYVIGIYLSTLITSYSISNALLNNKVKNKYLILIIGLVAVYILKLIPFVGAIISLTCILYGVGAISNYLIRRK